MRSAIIFLEPSICIVTRHPGTISRNKLEVTYLSILPFPDPKQPDHRLIFLLDNLSDGFSYRLGILSIVDRWICQYLFPSFVIGDPRGTEGEVGQCRRG